MDRIFKTLSKGKVVDLGAYINSYISEHKTVEILVGCDSQNRGNSTYYAIVVGLYRPTKGAHVLYTRFVIEREKDNVGRLLKEVWYSVEVAEAIYESTGIRATWIDIDLNPDPYYQSNTVLASAIGIVTGMGYKVRHKGNSPLMTYCADHLVK